MNKHLVKLMFLPMVLLSTMGAKKPIRPTNQSYFERIEVPPLSKSWPTYLRVKFHSESPSRTSIHVGYNLDNQNHFIYTYSNFKYKTIDLSPVFYPDKFYYSGGTIDLCFVAKLDMSQVIQTVIIKAYELKPLGSYVAFPNSINEIYSTPDDCSTLFTYPRNKITKPMTFSLENFNSLIFNDYYYTLDFDDLSINYGGLNNRYLNHYPLTNRVDLNMAAYLYLPRYQDFFDNLGEVLPDGRVKIKLDLHYSSGLDNYDKKIKLRFLNIYTDPKTLKGYYSLSNLDILGYIPTNKIFMPKDKFSELDNMRIRIEIFNIGEAFVNVILNSQVHFGKNYVGNGYVSQYSVRSEYATPDFSVEAEGKYLR